MRWLPALVASTIAAFTSISTASSEPLHTAILTNEGIGARTLVGDWEPPDMVVLVYGDSWLSSYVALLDVVSAVQPVILLSEPGDTEDARDSLDALRLEQRQQVWVPEYEVDSAWTRDYGPLQTRSSEGDVLWLDAPYFTDRPRDDDLPLVLAAWFGLVAEPIFDTLDGGALASNGRGLCVSTMEYFASADIDTSEADGSALLEQIGCQILALVPALAHEDTKHIDLFLQFLAPDLAVVARFDPSLDPEDARRADTAASVLERAARRLGQPLTVERIDSPTASGGRYRSYVNFLQLPDHLLVPGYDSVDPDLDDAALATLGRLAPSRTVVRIPADDPSDNGGAVHCLTWGLHLP